MDGESVMAIFMDVSLADPFDSLSFVCTPLPSPAVLHIDVSKRRRKMPTGISNRSIAATPVIGQYCTKSLLRLSFG